MTATPPKRTSLVRDSSGAALAEGAVVLPVFVLLMAFVGYFRDRMFAESDLGQEVRRSAWRVAVDGCEEGEPHPMLGDILDDDDFRRFRVSMPLLAEFADRIRWNLQVTTGTRHVENPSLLNVDTLVRGDLSVVCNERIPDSEPITMQAIYDAVCRAGGCAPAECECQVDETECVTERYMRTCVNFEGCGIWELPRFCEGDSACFSGGCEPCDPVPGDGELTDLPPCPDLESRGDEVITDFETWED